LQFVILDMLTTENLVPSSLFKRFRIVDAILAKQRSKDLQQYEWMEIPSCIKTIGDLDYHLRAEWDIEDFQLKFHNSRLRSSFDLLMS